MWVTEPCVFHNPFLLPCDGLPLIEFQTERSQVTWEDQRATSPRSLWSECLVTSRSLPLPFHSPFRVICLCAQFEAVLQHGLRRSRGLALTAAALKQAAGFSSKTDGGTTDWCTLTFMTHFFASFSFSHFQRAAVVFGIAAGPQNCFHTKCLVAVMKPE